MTNGQEGEPPEGYEIAKAALYWGVDPHKLIDWPLYFIELAFVISEAEKSVRDKRDDIAARKAERKSGRKRSR